MKTLIIITILLTMLSSNLIAAQNLQDFCDHTVLVTMHPSFSEFTSTRSMSYFGSFPMVSVESLFEIDDIEAQELISESGDYI